MNTLETFLKQESTENQFNELLTLSGLDTNGTFLLKFPINGIEYDIYTSHYIMFNNVKHLPLVKIKKIYGDKGNVIKQWLPFKEENGAGISGLGQSKSKIYLGDDGYIYYPDVNTITDYQVGVGSIRNKGLIRIAIIDDDDDDSGNGGGGTSPPTLQSLPALSTINGEGALGSTSRLAGFLKSPLVIGVVILGVGYVIYKFNIRKGR